MLLDRPQVSDFNLVPGRKAFHSLNLPDLVATQALATGEEKAGRQAD